MQSEADKEAGVPPFLFGESFMMANQGMAIKCALILLPCVLQCYLE